MSAVYLFLAFALVVFRAFDLTADFLGLALAAVFFLGLAVFFLTTVLRFGAAVTFRAAFLAAGACFRRVGAAGSIFIIGAGADFGSALSIIGAGVEETDPGADGAEDIADEEPAAAPAMAGVLIAVSQPGVNISSRSRDTGFARPQRGQ